MTCGLVVMCFTIDFFVVFCLIVTVLFQCFMLFNQSPHPSIRLQLLCRPREHSEFITFLSVIKGNKICTRWRNDLGKKMHWYYGAANERTWCVSVHTRRCGVALMRPIGGTVAPYGVIVSSNSWNGSRGLARGPAAIRRASAAASATPARAHAPQPQLTSQRARRGLKARRRLSLQPAHPRIQLRAATARTQTNPRVCQPMSSSAFRSPRQPMFPLGDQVRWCRWCNISDLTHLSPR